MNKESVRKDIIKKRRELSTEERLRLSDLICERVTSLSEFEQADTVLIYADYNGEVGTDKLICRALLDGRKVYAPVSNPDLTLDFYRVFALDEMEPGAFGIREPLRIEYLKLKDVEITDSTICITPGSLFDRDCNRMGYGKGFYDRFFEEHKVKHRIGLAYEMQITNEIEPNETDIPMTAVVTEENTYRAG